MSNTLAALMIEVTGVVQGVGFRPFVHQQATIRGLTGLVGNDSSKVFIEVAGPKDQLVAFVDAVKNNPPPLARISSVDVRSAPVAAATPSSFEIVDSRNVAGQRTFISPDTAVCADCRAELFDPNDRRFEHPFVTCTNCGPRLSIIRDLPYDRGSTTMASFEMCLACKAEYDDPQNRRYHAQPIGCHDCGPSMSFGASAEELSDFEPIRGAVDTLASGGVLAVKGIGGYHLVCDATNAESVASIRRRKNRPDKPFAVMVADLSQADELADLHELEIAELTSQAAPIVLARRCAAYSLPTLVAPGSPLIGIVLPYTPVHHLLLAALSRPLVVTSANPSGAPLAHTREVITDLCSLYDGLLDHNRDIVVPVDDSVVRLIGDAVVPIRRARGFAPIPMSFPNAKRSVLAVGGELKNTFCLVRGEHGWVSQHIGDMENLETLDAFGSMVDSYSSMYNVKPEVVAVDTHPGYLSSKWARRNAAEPVREVQHHHAHVAAVMAEHGLDPSEPVLGVAFDGTGYGTNGEIWGGEVLVADATSFDRVAHLYPVPLPGGDAAVKNPSRVALTHLAVAGIEWDDDLPPVTQLSEGERALLFQQLERSLACVPTTSMGRLFDAVASLLGIRHHISYEAQAAIELELLAHSSAAVQSTYRFGFDGTGVIDQRPVIAAIVADLRGGRNVADIAWSFHDAVAEAVEQVARSATVERSLTTVALTGGVFQNALLLSLCCDRLGKDFDVRTHKLVPANDGGLSLGQAFVAAHSSNREPTDKELLTNDSFAHH